MSGDVNTSCNWYDLPCNLTAFSDWLGDKMLYVPRFLWHELLDGVASTIEALPAPDFITASSATFGAIPSNVIYFTTTLHLAGCVGIFITAYTVRFLIRRIPIIG